MNSTGKPALLAALAFVLCLFGTGTIARAAGQRANTASRTPSASVHACPAPGQVNSELAKASAMMQQAHYRDAGEMLEQPALLNCGPRVSLLLAAAYNASGDASKAQQQLQKAHAAWPSNNSIAASLAHEYKEAGESQKALDALARQRCCCW